MHPLLRRQMHKAAVSGGQVDYGQVLELVNLAYEDHDRRDEMIASAQKRYELAVESTTDGIWDWDVASNRMWFSTRCKAMFGYGPEELDPCGIEGWYRLIHASDVELSRQFIGGYLRGEAPPALTLRFDYRSGGVLHIMCRVSTLKDSSGRVQRLVGVHTDITDMIAMQDAFKQERDRAQAASKAKSDFLANMSHEIRTPMNSIMGMIDLLLETPIDAQQKMWAEIAKHSSESLLDIINDILDISKIEAGKLDLEVISFDLAELVEQARNTMLLKAQEKNLELLMEYGKDVPRRLIGDPVHVRQLLINLVGNAIKFTSKGHVKIAVKTESVSGDQAELRFEVSDTGIGIPEDKQHYIFEKFTQAEESTTRKYGGTGLGLAICRRLVHLMNGDIGVRSKPGEGSTFYFALTLRIDRNFKPDVKPEAAAKNLPSVDYSRVNVLVVEDIPANQIYMKALLKKHECPVEIAKNGIEAVEKVKQRPYDVVFMDCQMPEMDGFEATRIIRTLALPKQPRIVALTADAMQGDRERCLAAGMDDYLNKPVKAAKIISVLEQSVHP